VEIYSLLPKELQRKIKYMTLEHPTAQIMKDHIKLYNMIYKNRLVHFVDYTKWHTVYGSIKIKDIKHYSITTNLLFDEDQGVVKKDDKWFLWVRKKSHGDIYKQIPDCINIIYKIDNGREFIKFILENQELKYKEELFDDIIDNDSDDESDDESNDEYDDN
jgi:hypothetical protein